MGDEKGVVAGETVEGAPPSWPTTQELADRVAAIEGLHQQQLTVIQERLGRLDAMQRPPAGWTQASWALRPFSADRRVRTLAIPMNEVPGGVEAYMNEHGPLAGRLAELMNDYRTKRLTDAIFPGSTIQGVTVDMATGELRLLLWHEKYDKIGHGQPAPLVRRRV